MRKYGRVSILLIAVQLLAGVVAWAQEPEPVLWVPPSQRQPTYWTRWNGGARNLPYGSSVSSSLVLQTALSMPWIQDGIGRMQSRGYLRRTDMDGASSRDGYACAVVAFEKPGVAPTAEQPIIFVSTAPIPAIDQMTGDTIAVVATQVFAGMVADSSGTVVTRETASDPSEALTVTPALNTTATVMPLMNSEDLEYRYAGYSLASNGASDPYTAVWNAIPPVWRNFGIYVGVGAAAGYAGGGGWLGAAVWGAASGVLYWFGPPCSCPPTRSDPNGTRR